ncbi:MULTISPECIES: type IV pilus modification PilV family protein [Thermus]|jgi:prepilin-type N-terminal cleavage/methylation domain-containing protein|uniref:Prepilin-type N-terminal cleavage/methylation domain-containing protein n=1 Tax=Thermus brockianus TaxID=56956 RepID=A0A1J0LTU6_THEBO|nr:prepilin-type N-terminal cleavage/methylation domain-containing protein [Thermus brockianus]APD08863.1 secretion system protein [Thermus brockianus]BDG15712.1 prepilin-type N-terminal cleavage/methylation domain-containing protein [Thermus brockianus]
MRRSAQGLTLLEVLIALSILALVLLAFNAVLVSSLRQTSVSGARTQAVQILNYLGRRIVGGDSFLLSGSTSIVYGYGELRQNFPDLPQEARFANPDLYRAEIRNAGSPSWANNLGVSVNEYRIQVCWRQAGQEHCTEARTFSAPPSGSGSAPPPLEGIN